MPKRPKPELPRLVEQLRALLFIQRYLTVLGVLVVIFWGVYVAKLDEGTFDSAARAHLDATEKQLALTFVALVLVAVALAVCGKLLWRGWKWVYLLILATEAVVIDIIVQGVETGWAGGLLALLYAGFTAWILVNLFRGEVLAFVWRRADRRAASSVNLPLAR